MHTSKHGYRVLHLRGLGENLPGERSTNLASVYACLSKVWQKSWPSLIRLSLPGWEYPHWMNCRGDYLCRKLWLVWESDCGVYGVGRRRGMILGCADLSNLQFIPFFHSYSCYFTFLTSRVVLSTEIHPASWETVTTLSTHSKMMSAMIHTVF